MKSTHQTLVDNWIKEYGVRYFNELTNMVLLMEETGELARYMARMYGEQSFKDEEQQSVAQEKIKEEIADVYFVLLCLANQMNINLEKELLDSIAKKTNRDKLRHKENTKLNKQ